VPLTSIAMLGWVPPIAERRLSSFAGSVLGYNETFYRGDYYLAGRRHVSEIRWTPNRMTYEVRRGGSEPTSLSDQSDSCIRPVAFGAWQWIGLSRKVDY